MTGMERNSDIVQMASYAPLFANVNGIQWLPDLIYYDNSRLCGTPSYYVQQMFSQNRGDYVLPVALSGNLNITSPPPRGAVGLGSWNTSVQYTGDHTKKQAVLYIENRHGSVHGLSSTFDAVTFFGSSCTDDKGYLPGTSYF